LGAGSADLLWQTLVASVPFYVAVISPERRILFLNRTRGSRPVSELVGRRIDELDERLGRELGPVLDRVLTGRGSESIELPASMDQAPTMWLEIHVSALVAPGTGLIGALLVARDVTDSRQVAIELRMSVNALHRLIDAREQLAHDLHDGILQSLYGVGLRLEAAKRALRAPGDGATAHLERAVAQLNETMTEIRRFIAGGSGTVGSDAPWEESLVGMIRGLEVEGAPAIEVAVDSGAAERVPAPYRSEFLLIAREAVSNAIRHSGAGRVVVRLAGDNGSIQLEVDDDGRGLLEQPNDSGLGILTMTRRASRIGATLTLHSTPQTGTLVRVELSAPEARHG
jgi:signal transduction histidine kinase